jgi:hypothetical protein
MDSSSYSKQSTDRPKSAATSAKSGIEMVPQGRALHCLEQCILAPKDDSLLPPADGGRHAWLFLVGCFVFEALVWGMFPYTY